MSLHITSQVANQYVDFGSGASIDNYGVFTSIIWFKPTANAPGLASRIWDKNAGVRFTDAQTYNFNCVNLRVSRSTNLDVYTAANTLIPGRWYFIACTFTELASPSGFIYVGTETEIVTEYPLDAGSVQGSGNAKSDASRNLHVGNRADGFPSAGAGAIGDFGPFAYLNVVLSLPEIQSIHQRFENVFRWYDQAGIVSLLGQHGLGEQADLSGNGNVGVFTGPIIYASDEPSTLKPDEDELGLSLVRTPDVVFNNNRLLLLGVGV